MPGGADARVAVAGGGDPAAAARRTRRRTRASTCAASTTRSSAARSCPAIGCGSRSRSAGGATSLARAQAAAYRRRSGRRRGRAAARPGRRSRPRSIRSAIVAPARADRRGHDDRPARDRSAPHVTHRRELPDRRLGGRSTAGPRSATTREIYPFASIGLVPQDLKFQRRGDAADDRQAQHLPRVRHHPPRHARAAAASRRSAIATCSWPTCTSRTTATSATTRSSATWRRSAATSTVEDFANISAGSGVHQFCRVGRHAFIGGYSVVTKDALPYARTVGSRPARIYGVNTIGLMRRGFTADVIDQAEALVPLPAAVEAEHDAARCSRSSRIGRWPAPKCSTWSTSSAPRSAA